MRRVMVSTFLFLVLGGCGDDSGPTGPSTPATPTVTGLTVSGLDAIRTGFVSNYTATATLSNGTTQGVSPTWTSSDPSVATVDGTGRLSGTSHGSITLSASYQGANGSKMVNVVNNYGGAWEGTYLLRACDQSGVFIDAEWCEGLGGVGSILPIMLAFSQSGDDQRQINGSITLGTGITGNITGNVTGNGRLVLQGTFTVTSEGVTFEFAFGGWDTRLVSPGQMAGRWAQSQRAVGVPGNAYQEVEIVTMIQTSTGVTVRPAPSHYTLSWSEVFEAIRH